MSIPRKTLLDNVKSSNNAKILPFVTTHNPNYSNKFSIVKEAMNNLINDTHLNPIYKNVKLIHSRRQSKNLKQILTRAEFKQNQNYKVTRCQSARCKICDILIEGSVFEFNPKIFTVNDNMSCNVLNCIYAIKCGGCRECYIGETNNFRSRTNLHKDHIRRGVGLNVSLHIKNCNAHHVEEKDQFKIMPIFKIKKDDTALRKKKWKQIS